MISRPASRVVRPETPPNGRPMTGGNRPCDGMLISPTSVSVVTSRGTSGCLILGRWREARGYSERREQDETQATHDPHILPLCLSKGMYANQRVRRYLRSSCGERSASLRCRPSDFILARLSPRAGLECAELDAAERHPEKSRDLVAYRLEQTPDSRGCGLRSNRRLDDSPSSSASARRPTAGADCRCRAPWLWRPRPSRPRVPSRRNAEPHTQGRQRVHSRAKHDEHDGHDVHDDP